MKYYTMVLLLPEHDHTLKLILHGGAYGQQNLSTMKAIWDYYLHGINSFSCQSRTDYTGLSATSVVKIELVDVPEKPSVLPSSFSIIENLPAQSQLGTVSAFDQMQMILEVCVSLCKDKILMLPSSKDVLNYLMR